MLSNFIGAFYMYNSKNVPLRQEGFADWLSAIVHERNELTDGPLETAAISNGTIETTTISNMVDAQSSSGFAIASIIVLAIKLLG